MLKIKDNVDLKELEKYGFKFCFYNLLDGTKELQRFKYMRYKLNIYILRETKERVIKVKSTSYETMSILYDLIKADLVEKVSDE